MTTYSSLTPQPGYSDGRARFDRHTVGRRTVIDVAGEVDLLTSPGLRTGIDKALEAGALELWIDLTATEFMDSSGLHAPVDAHARMSELQRRLTIICPPEGGIRRLFEVAGVSDRLPIADDRATAHRYSG
jgi:anti-sigma B factor antagonist